MRMIVQRVSSAGVTINNIRTTFIHQGLMVLAGIGEMDGTDDVEWLTKKVCGLRIFNDSAGVMNVSLKDCGGDLLLISQFTLLASTRKGNRPSYIPAAKPETAIPLYEQLIKAIEAELGKGISTGVFGADMKVDLVNDGPVTIILDSKNRE